MRITQGSLCGPAPKKPLIQLDLPVHARRKLELHEGVHGLVRGVQNVHEPLVRADFELVPGVLIAVRGGQNCKTLHFDGQRHGTLDGRTGAFRGIDDLAGRLVDQAVIESLQADANILISHKSSLNIQVGGRPRPSEKLRAAHGKGADSTLVKALSRQNLDYAITLATTPAPTVLPPSRMAKRRPCSIAIGAISSTTILMLSPGITISVPSGSSTAPVTSVVRK